MQSSLILGILLLASNPVLAAVYTITPGTAFHTEPSGQTINADPSMIETPPLESKNCFDKVVSASPRFFGAIEK